jgi:hypothetical protein
MINITLKPFINQNKANLVILKDTSIIFPHYYPKLYIKLGFHRLELRNRSIQVFDFDGKSSICFSLNFL